MFEALEGIYLNYLTFHAYKLPNYFNKLKNSNSLNAQNTFGVIGILQ